MYARTSLAGLTHSSADACLGNEHQGQCQSILGLSAMVGQSQLGAADRYPIVKRRGTWFVCEDNGHFDNYLEISPEMKKT